MNFKLSQKAVTSIHVNTARKFRNWQTQNGKYPLTVADAPEIAVQTGCVANNQKRREFYGSLPFF